MISKELLDEVLGKRCIAINEGIPRHLKSENTLFYRVDGEYGLIHNINIYELGHLVKNWIVTKGYTLVEAPLMLRITRLSTEENKFWEYTLEEQTNQEYFKIEYVFKAGEYILGLDK